MGNAREHLAHGGKFLRLDELFRQALEIGNVTAGENDALNIPVFIGQGTEIETNPPPVSQFVANTNFHGSKSLPPGDNVFVKGYHGGQIFRVSASPELHLVGLIHFVTQDLSAARADKGIVRVGVKDLYQIRKVVKNAACEFLLLVEAALHLTALGDIHERALISKDAAGIVADAAGGYLTNDGIATPSLPTV